MSVNKAIFLDRDGVINRERGYVKSWANFELFPWTVEALKLIRASEYLPVVITNQSGIAKGLYSVEDVRLIHQKLNLVLEKHNAEIERFYFCPHHPQGSVKEYSIKCLCRKPSNGLVLQAAADLNISLKDSFFIGDSERDIIAGKRSGCTTYGVKTGHGFDDARILPDFLCDNLLDAAKSILSL